MQVTGRTYSRTQFGATVKNDFANRRSLNVILESEGLTASASRSGLEPVVKASSLGHPEFEHLEVGQSATKPMAAVFLDLTNFTGRTFWDPQEETVDLALAVLTGFIEVVSNHGGHPLGLRGDGLFAGFSPGDPAFTASMALGACAFALDAVENEVNPWLKNRGMAPVQARAGLDYGDITFVRTGNSTNNEVNPLGFAANFAAKCEKAASSWEIVVGEGLVNLMPDQTDFEKHPSSPKTYTRDYQSRQYRFYDYKWRRAVPALTGVAESLGGTPTSLIYQR